MPSNPLAPGSWTPDSWTPGILSQALVFGEGSAGLSVPKALGRQPPLEEGAETRPPPAAVSRAETVFETTGLILVLLIVLAALWILVRKRL